MDDVERVASDVLTILGIAQEPSIEYGSDERRDRVAAVIRKAITAAGWQRVGPDMVVVPREPSDAMLKQGAIAFYAAKHLATYAHRIPDIYRAMISAAPPASPESGEG